MLKKKILTSSFVNHVKWYWQKREEGKKRLEFMLRMKYILMEIDKNEKKKKNRRNSI